MEINGKQLTRESVREWLKGKRVILWMDWLIGEPDQMELAVDWFMKAVNDVASATA